MLPFVSNLQDSFHNYIFNDHSSSEFGYVLLEVLVRHEFALFAKSFLSLFDHLNF